MDDKSKELRPNYYKVHVEATVEIDDSLNERRRVEVECFDLIDALGLGFYEANVLKYLFRAGRKTKDKREDLRKVFTYARHALDRHQEIVDGTQRPDQPACPATDQEPKPLPLAPWQHGTSMASALDGVWLCKCGREDRTEADHKRHLASWS